ncbi:hypothetical protein L1887_09734 [Cichorium endivia]|nr:hypothetical protein L1887_09734 [Cichorium endivia]
MSSISVLRASLWKLIGPSGFIVLPLLTTKNDIRKDYRSCESTLFFQPEHYRGKEGGIANERGVGGGFVCFLVGGFLQEKGSNHHSFVRTMTTVDFTCTNLCWKFETCIPCMFTFYGFYLNSQLLHYCFPNMNIP